MRYYCVRNRATGKLSTGSTKCAAPYLYSSLPKALGSWFMQHCPDEFEIVEVELVVK